MCWTCNPLCGGCRPPRKRAVKCPQCNAFNVFDIAGNRMSATSCKKCGHELGDLAKPVAQVCVLCGLVCYNPCRKATRKASDEEDSFQECKSRVSEPIILG